MFQCPKFIGKKKHITMISQQSRLKQHPGWKGLLHIRVFLAIDQNVFEMTEKNQVISVRMSENTG